MLPVSRGETAAATRPPTWVSVRPSDAAFWRSTRTARNGSAADRLLVAPVVSGTDCMVCSTWRDAVSSCDWVGAVTSTSMSLLPPNPPPEDAMVTSPTSLIAPIDFRASAWIVGWSASASVVTAYCTEALPPPPNAAWIDWPLVPMVVCTVSTPSTSCSARSTLRADSDWTARLEPAFRSCVTVNVFCPESPR
jgi:hypothetical protein